MVRRSRETKIISAVTTTTTPAAAAVAAAATTTTNGVAATVAAVSNGGGNLLDEQYFASPKRKDCKVDNVVDADIAAILLECSKAGKSNQRNATDDAIDNTKYRRNHNALVVGKVTGVPFTTRSQTKTIENFFKAKTAEISANLKGVDKLKTHHIHSSCKAPPPASAPQPPHASKSQTNSQIIAIHEYNEDTELLAALQDDRLPHGGVCSGMLPEFIFDLSEDTNDTDTELSDELVIANTMGGGGDGAMSLAGVHDFMAHRSSSIRDSHSSSRSSFATDNIFLQEPVLTLNVDKTPNQASSIKINRSLESGPIFSSPPSSLTASVLNGRFNQCISLNGGSPSSKRESFCLDIKPLLPDNDNSSCDSGVAFISTAMDNKDNIIRSPCVVTAVVTAPQTRRRKPTTPHRIVCPSPVKAAARIASPAPAGGKGHSPTTRKMNAAKEQLSPRKSPRHNTTSAISSKTRRRLNPQTDKPPSCSSLAVASVQSDIKQNGHVATTTNHCIAVQHDEPFETVLKSTNHSSAKTTNGMNSKCPTKGHAKSASAKSSNCVKTQTQQQQQPKNKQQQLPLAATNGNRELTEFFPVRRSVRKTKTAVKEEMMRNLEQAVLEERSAGLKIAHFEGKGRGVIADQRFNRGEFVVEYVGDLISMTEAGEREKRYALDENAGCYMYYFKHKNQQYCIDATEDTGKLGRLVNHSRNGNLITKVVVVKQRPHLILIAKDDIEPGEEITYDYGDRSKESLLHHPWLAF